MGVFTAAPVFCGLGKASLKLDFETETQLKDFARRYIVDEGDETPDNDPDPEKAAKAIINNLYRRTTGDAYMKPHKGGVDGPGDVYIITDTRSKAKKELDEIKALQKYEVQKFNKEALKDIEEGDPLLFEQIKNDLNGYGDKYTVVDNRKRARKEPGELASNKNLVFTKEGKAAENYNKEAYNTDNFKKVVVIYNFDGLFVEFQIFKVYTKATEKDKDDYGISVKKGADGKYYKGSLQREIVSANIDDLYNITDYVAGKRQAYVTNETYEKYYNNALKLFFNYLERQIKYAKEQIENFNKYKYQYKYDTTKEEQRLLQMLKDAERVYKYNLDFYGLTNPQGDLGKTADNSLYNNKDLMVCQGMTPTYKILPNYDRFFAPAENKNSFAGFGLDDTKELIADTCRKHYKECAAIAEHLKGDTMLQSCFNLWHWMHHNIKYEYDRDGREEVRTPLRVWADRKHGVDCDCLSVFAWCVLTCMGYHPAFELVAFNNKKAFSHIFINCDGVVVDRVWFIFNQRPPMVTKREIYKVNLLDNLGKLF